VAAFHSSALRVYASEDVVGVEVGGAVKNVLAIATGLCDGLNLGLNARAALITRGLTEMTRLGMALGARAETFMGLSGLGDLVLTATGDLSRNRKVGLALAQGKTLEQAVEELGHVAEGVYSARTVWQRASSLGVAMPITQGVVDLLDGKLQAHQAGMALMGRGPAAEGYQTRRGRVLLCSCHFGRNVGHGFFYWVYQYQTQLAGVQLVQGGINRQKFDEHRGLLLGTFGIDQALAQQRQHFAVAAATLALVFKQHHFIKGIAQDFGLLADVLVAPVAGTADHHGAAAGRHGFHRPHQGLDGIRVVAIVGNDRGAAVVK